MAATPWGVIAFMVGPGCRSEGRVITSSLEVFCCGICAWFGGQFADCCIRCGASFGSGRAATCVCSPCPKTRSKCISARRSPAYARSGRIRSRGRPRGASAPCFGPDGATRERRDRLIPSDYRKPELLSTAPAWRPTQVLRTRRMNNLTIREYAYFFMAKDQSVSPAPTTMYCCPSSS